MFSPRRLQIGVCLASTMVLSLIADAATKTLPSRVAQMTAPVCWEACSVPCDKTYEKCHARNSNFGRAHLTGDCCNPMVGLSLTAQQIAANVAKLPEKEKAPEIRRGFFRKPFVAMPI